MLKIVLVLALVACALAHPVPSEIRESPMPANLDEMEHQMNEEPKMAIGGDKAETLMEEPVEKDLMEPVMLEPATKLEMDQMIEQKQLNRADMNEMEPVMLEPAKELEMDQMVEPKELNRADMNEMEPVMLEPAMKLEMNQMMKQQELNRADMSEGMMGMPTVDEKNMMEADVAAAFDMKDGQFKAETDEDKKPATDAQNADSVLNGVNGGPNNRADDDDEQDKKPTIDAQNAESVNDKKYSSRADDEQKMPLIDAEKVLDGEGDGFKTEDEEEMAAEQLKAGPPSLEMLQDSEFKADGEQEMPMANADMVEEEKILTIDPVDKAEEDQMPEDTQTTGEKAPKDDKMMMLKPFGDDKMEMDDDEMEAMKMMKMKMPKELMM